MRRNRIARLQRHRRPGRHDDVDSLERAFDAAKAAFGTVGVVVSNAGITDPRDFMKIDAAALDNNVLTNGGV